MRGSLNCFIVHNWTGEVAGLGRKNFKLQCSSEKFWDRLIGSSKAKECPLKKSCIGQKQPDSSTLSKFSNWLEAVTSWRECSISVRCYNQKVWQSKAFTQLQSSHQVLLKVYLDSVDLRPPHRVWNSGIENLWGTGEEIGRNNSIKVWQILVWK